MAGPPSKPAMIAKKFVGFWGTTKCAPTLRATLSFTTGLILVLSTKFQSLYTYPQTLSFISIATIITFSGKPVGACVAQVLLAMIGVGLGSICFVILAKLHTSQVAQGVLLTIFVYVFATIKTKGIFFFPFAIMGILVSIQGIQSSIIFSAFKPHFLADIYKTFAWGGAIGLFINVTVLPITAEQELRKTLALSLHHIAHFNHLLARTYTLEITPEERSIRDELAVSISADFEFLSQFLGMLTLELSYSRYSLDEYSQFIQRTRAMQQSLIAVHSSLKGFEKVDITLFRTSLLPATTSSFQRLRASVQLTIRDLIKEFGADPASFDTNQAGYSDYLDLERQSSIVVDPSAEPLSAIASPMAQSPIGTIKRQHRRNRMSMITIDDRLQSVTQRINEELANQSHRADSFVEDDEDDEPDFPVKPMTAHLDLSVSTLAEPEIPGTPRSFMYGKSNGSLNHYQRRQAFNAAPAKSAAVLRTHFRRFSQRQQSILADTLISGLDRNGDDRLLINDPLPSLQDKWSKPIKSGLNTPPSNVTSPPPSAAKFNVKRRPVPSSPPGLGNVERMMAVMEEEPRAESWAEDEQAMAQHIDYAQYNQDTLISPPPAFSPIVEKDEQYTFDVKTASVGHLSVHLPPSSAPQPSLMRVYSLLFAMEQFVDELEALYYAAGASTQTRFRVRILEKLFGPRTSTGVDSNNVLTLKESIAILRGALYVTPQMPFGKKLEDIETWFRRPDSIYAAKTAAAVTIFMTILLADSSRAKFLDYNLIGGAIILVTALWPTLGQTFLVWALQIVGTTLGYLWGCAVLSMFHNVGGYAYNPYGLVALSFPFILLLSFLFYEVPKLFIACLLGLNALGTTIINQIMNEVVLKNTHFGKPVESLTGLSLAIALGAGFQLFVFRVPARHTLRKRLAALTFKQLGHATLLQHYVRAATPSNPRHRAHQSSLERIEKELRRRELDAQSEIIQLGPIHFFASIEPKFAREFNGKALLQLIRGSQKLLDGLREARMSVGNSALPDIILTDFIRVLAPYRRATSRRLQNSLYLSASSLTSKAPMPREYDHNMQTDQQLHDALVLIKRLGTTPQGREAIHGGAFTKYFHYLMCMDALKEHLANMEAACRELYGNLEDKLA